MRIIFFLALLCPCFSNCQPLPIEGRIINEQMDPVAGATIILQRTGATTLSDAEGKFTFPEGTRADTLIISAIGYETKKEPNNERGLMTVILSRKVQALQEIIINTGYQSVSPERTTGAYTIIGNSKFNQQATTNVLERLPAIANALTLDQRTNQPGYTIRGLSTIQGQRGPLIVLDNFPYEGALTNINPNDVESVTILKDAAAASIWGTKAANGVIVITTKKGGYHQPLTIELNNNMTVRQKPDLYYLPAISSADFIEVEKFLFDKGFYNNQLNAATRPPVSPVVEILARKAAGQISDAESNQQINIWRAADIRRDFDQLMYQPARMYQHALTIRGGSGALASLFSAGFDHQVSELSASSRRINLRWQNQARLGSKWSLTTQAYYTTQASTGGRPALSELSTANGVLPPYMRIADDEGNALAVIKNHRQSFIDTAGGGKLLNWNYYPLTEYTYTHPTNSSHSFLTDVGLQYRIIPALTADLKYQYETQNSTGRTQYDVESYFARDLINSFTQLNRNTGEVTYQIPPAGILDLNRKQLTAHNVRGQFAYNKKFNSDYLSVIAGAEARQITNDNDRSRTYGFNPDILTFAYVDYNTRYPLYLGGTNFIPAVNGFGLNTDRFISLYGNGAFTLKNKYTVSLSGRRDASNLFGVATNDKWTPLWSAGAAWNISNENFYKSNAFPYLKLRASYGYSGNADQSRSAVTVFSYLSNSPFTFMPYARIERFANPDLRWEQVKMINAAIEFRTAFDRITGTLEYFRKDAFDLFAFDQIDPTAGIGSTIIRNAGTMQGNGVDLQLHSINVNRAIRWESDLNFNYYTDKVTRYYLPSQQASNFIGSTTPNITGIVGRPLYSVYAYPWGGLDENGDPQALFNGQVTKDYAAITGTKTSVTDLTWIGPALPTVYGSLGNTLAWKNFSVTARLMYKLGYYLRIPTINYDALFSSRVGHPDYALRWQKPGDEQITSVPAMVYPAVRARDQFYAGSEPNVIKGDHVRLQFVTLTYNVSLPPSSTVRSLQFYVNGNDLGVLWKANKSGIDPDYSVSSIPVAKSFTAGIKASF